MLVSLLCNHGLVLNNVSIDYKSLNENDLRRMFGDLGYRFKKPPRKHQLVSLAFALDEGRKRVQYFHDIGTGKTVSALYTTQVWDSRRILVVCPSSAFWAWEHDTADFTDYSISTLSGSFDEKIDMLCQMNKIYVINYEGLKTLYADKHKRVTDRHGDIMVDGGWYINPTYFDDMFDTIIFDEVHRCKNKDAVQTNICYQLSRVATHAIGLSGTPVSASYQDLYSEFLVVDLGKALGNNYYAFRNRYFEGRDHSILKSNAEETILNKIAPMCLSYDISECCDLPPKSLPIRRIVVPSREQHQLLHMVYNDLKHEFNEGTLSIQNVTHKSAKARQIACGFIYLRDDDEKSVRYLKSNPKIRALEDIIDECRTKIVIFHKLESEAIVIEDMCARKGIQFSAIRGSVDKNDRKHEYSKFVTNDNVKLMIAQYECASESYDMSCSYVCVFFSPVASPRLRSQAEGRIYRSGQTRPVLFIDIVMKGSTDDIVLEHKQDRHKMLAGLLSYIGGYH